MKKLILASIALLCSITVDSQIMEVYRNGAVAAEYRTSEIDSIVFDVHDCVDLGLPSGTLWATCNIGAERPEECGLYFAWGETKGYTGETSDGRSFNWTGYKWCKGTYGSQTRYCTSTDYGTVDNKAELEPEDDAATVNWGSAWKMPGWDQIKELIDFNNTTTEWTTSNGVSGMLVTSKSNGNTLFFPAAGFRQDGKLSVDGSYGEYWSRTLNSDESDFAYYLIFFSGYTDWDGYCRSHGRSVRAVRAQ